MAKTTTFLIEEHNEAFYVWLYSLKKQLIKEQGNILLHFDDHSDMSTPRFNTSIKEFSANTIELIQDFTYQELGIATFIMPAIYLKLISDVWWVKYDTKKEQDVDMFIKSYDDNNKYLISGKKSALTKETLTKSVSFFNYKNIDATSFDKTSLLNNNILLDIDLDYFSCNDNPYNMNEIMIEITEEEYLEFQKNEYHYLNFIVTNIKAIKYQGNFYYVINYFKDIHPSSRKVNKETICKRVDDFIKSLKKQKVVPQIITICRSRYSGFTPIDQWELIEEKLLLGLQEIYNIDVHHISKITSKKLSHV